MSFGRVGALGRVSDTPHPGGHTFYVASNGDDNADGLTQATAWQTVSNTNSKPQRRGNTYLFRGGDTFTDNALTPIVDGITYGSYGTGRATIAPIGQNGAFVADVSNIIIKNFTFTGNNTAGTAGVFIDTTLNVARTNVTVSGCTISAFGGTGITVGDDSPGLNSGYSFVTLTGNTISSCTINGIDIYGGAANGGAANAQSITNLEISNNAISSIPGNNANTSNGSAIDIQGTNGALVSGNVITGCGGSNVTAGGPVGILLFKSNSVTVQFNEVYSMTNGYGIDIDDNCNSCIVQYNYTHGNPQAGYFVFNTVGTAGNNTIRYNISENDGTIAFNGMGGISLECSSGYTGLQIYGNTVYNSNTSCFGIQSGGAGSLTGCIVSNNVFYSHGSTYVVDGFTANPSSSNVQMIGNDYFASGAFQIRWNNITQSTFAAWQSASSQEKVSGINVALTADPLIASGGAGGTISGGGAGGAAVTPAQFAAFAAYKLAHGSTMFQAGRNLTSQFSISPGATDFYSNAIATASLSVGANCPTSAP